MLKKIIYILIGFVSRLVGNVPGFLVLENRPFPSRFITDHFHTSNTRTLPVYDHYRYSIKSGYLSFDNILHVLNSKGLLTETERDFLAEAEGPRTINRSIAEIRHVTRQAALRNKNIFFPESLEGISSPILIPDKDETARRLSYFKKSHRLLFTKLKTFGIHIRQASVGSLLEIGFISGGHSLFAFERLGIKTFGIDNFYGGRFGNFVLPNYLKKELNSSVDFSCGDISHRTSFEDNFFDVVYSVSVLEHIHDLPHAFSEMYRILKPGGVMIHSYNPFFSPNGGHALGTLDCPWGHVRISGQDYIRYMHELRPYEAPISEEWIKSSLHYTTISQMQRCVADQGFMIIYWQQNCARKSHLLGLSSAVMSECFEIHHDLTVADLISSDISFVAVKESSMPLNQPPD